MAGTSRVATSSPAAAGAAASAVFQVLLGVSCLSGSDAFAKALGEGVPAEEVTWLRYAVFACATLAVAGAARRGSWRSRRPVLQVLRALAVLASAQFFVLGLGGLGIAEATAVAFVAPFIVTALSIPLLGEQVGPRRWFALAIGLVGVLLVVQPGARAFSGAALFPLVSAFFGALGVIAARKLGSVDPPGTTLIWTALIGFGALTLTAPLWFRPLTPTAVLLGLGMGVLYAIGQALLIRAYATAPASVLAPFTYAQLLAATLLGLVIFNRAPNAIAAAGMAAIAFSGAYTLLRERYSGRVRPR